MSEELLDRKDFKAIIRQFASNPGEGIWVRGREFETCALEYRLEVNGSAMSSTCLKSALNSLISRGYVTRLRWRMTVSPAGSKARMIRLSREDPRDYYNDHLEHWEYLPTPDLKSLIDSLAKEKTSQFAS